MKTNYEIELWKETITWQKAKSEALVDYYNAWVEFDNQWTFINGVASLIGKGLVIMSEDVDLTDCFLKINSIRYEIAQKATFYDRRGDFHHIEIIFK